MSLFELCPSNFMLGGATKYWSYSGHNSDVLHVELASLKPGEPGRGLFRTFREIFS